MDNFVFYPNKNYKYLIPFVAVFEAVTLFLAVYLFFNLSAWVVLFITISFLDAGLLIYFYYSYKSYLIFDNIGVTISEPRKKTQYEWNSFSYFYKTKNYRGFPYIIFSPKELTKKQVSKLIYGIGLTKNNSVFFNISCEKYELMIKKLMPDSTVIIDI